jgi:hypothetical protein
MDERLSLYFTMGCRSLAVATADLTSCGLYLLRLDQLRTWPAADFICWTVSAADLASCGLYLLDCICCGLGQLRTLSAGLYLLRTWPAADCVCCGLDQLRIRDTGAARGRPVQIPAVQIPAVPIPAVPIPAVPIPAVQIPAVQIPADSPRIFCRLMKASSAQLLFRLDSASRSLWRRGGGGAPLIATDCY